MTWCTELNTRPNEPNQFIKANYMHPFQADVEPCGAGFLCEEGSTTDTFPCPRGAYCPGAAIGTWDIVRKEFCHNKYSDS